MPREIDDAEYNKLLGKSAVADFIQTIWDHPKAGKPARRLVKEVYPNIEIPDLDIEDRVDTKINALLKAQKDEEAAKAAAAERAQWDADKAEVIKQYGYTDEGIKELEDFMVKNKVASYKVAAGYHAAKNPRPSNGTEGAGDGMWNHGRSDEWKKVAADPEEFARKEFMRAIRADEAKVRGGVF